MTTTYAQPIDPRTVDGYTYAADIVCPTCAAADILKRDDRPGHAARLLAAVTGMTAADDGADLVEGVRYLLAVESLRQDGSTKRRNRHDYIRGCSVWSGPGNLAHYGNAWNYADSDAFPQPLNFDTGASLTYTVHPRNEGETCGECHETIDTGWCPVCDDEREPSAIVQDDQGEATGCTECQPPEPRDALYGLGLKAVAL